MVVKAMILLHSYMAMIFIIISLAQTIEMHLALIPGCMSNSTIRLWMDRIELILTGQDTIYGIGNEHIQITNP